MALTALLIPMLFAFASLGCSVLKLISLKNVRNVKNTDPANLVNISPKKVRGKIIQLLYTSACV